MQSVNAARGFRYLVSSECRRPQEEAIVPLHQECSSNHVHEKFDSHVLSIEHGIEEKVLVKRFAALEALARERYRSNCIGTS